MNGLASLAGIEDYFVEILNEILNEIINSPQPVDVEQFIEKRRIPLSLRRELRERSRLALLRREAARTLRGEAPTRDFLLRLDAIERITYSQ